MTWIRHQPRAAEHDCPTPTRQVRTELPPPPPPPNAKAGWEPGPQAYAHMRVPDGSIGDLWRCDDCGRLWRFMDRPDFNNGRVHELRHPGWEPASLWQRIRYRNAEESTR